MRMRFGHIGLNSMLKIEKHENGLCEQFNRLKYRVNRTYTY